MLKTWLSDALSASPSSAISPFGPASDATAEAVSCVLQTLLRIPVDLKRIAASKIGHLVMKLHTTGGDATSGGGASAISLQIQEIYKTATRVVTLWKDTKAKTAVDASAATADSNKSGASTKTSSSSQPTPLPLMATLSSSSKHSKSSATMVIDDDVVEASKKRPRSSSAKGNNSTEDGGKGNSSSSSSSSTTTTSKKSKTEGEFIYKENNKYCRRSMLKVVYQIEKTPPPLSVSLYGDRLYNNNNMMKNKYIIDLGLFSIGPEMNDR